LIRGDRGAERARWDGSTPSIPQYQIGHMAEGHAPDEAWTGTTLLLYSGGMIYLVASMQLWPQHN